MTPVGYHMYVMTCRRWS